MCYLRWNIRIDKTQGFHDQIEVKQKEPQPWIAKINAKQAEIDVHDAIAKKAEALKEARKEVQENLGNLQGDQEVKVESALFWNEYNWTSFLIACRAREVKGEQE